MREVAKAINTANSEKVIETLKPVKEEIKCEIKISENLRGGPHVGTRAGFVKAPGHEPASVLELVSTAATSPVMPDAHVYEVLRPGLWSRLEVMHRDGQPRNAMADGEHRKRC